MSIELCKNIVKFDVIRKFLPSDHAKIDSSFYCDTGIGNIITRSSNLGRYDVPSKSDTKKAIPYSCIDRNVFVTEIADLEPPTHVELTPDTLVTVIQNTIDSFYHVSSNSLIRSPPVRETKLPRFLNKKHLERILEKDDKRAYSNRIH